MPSYDQNGSSLSSRLATQWQQKTGRPPDPNDPEYVAWVQPAMQALIAEDQGDYERSKSHWAIADKIATGVTLGVLGMGVGSAIAGGGAAGAATTGGGAAGGGAVGGATLPAAATEGIAFDAAVPAATGGLGTGGFLSAAGGIGKIAAGAGQQSAVNRQVENNQTLNADAAAERAKLDRARLGLEAPGIRARQSVLGSMMQNMQPVGVENMNPRLEGRVPHITGGMTPEMLSAMTRQQGGELQKAALEAQFTGSDIPPMTDFTPKPASKLENALGGTGLLGSVLGEIGDLMDERQQKRGWF